MMTLDISSQQQEFVRKGPPCGWVVCSFMTATSQSLIDYNFFTVASEPAHTRIDNVSAGCCGQEVGRRDWILIRICIYWWLIDGGWRTTTQRELGWLSKHHRFFDGLIKELNRHFTPWNGLFCHLMSPFLPCTGTPLNNFGRPKTKRILIKAPRRKEAKDL